MIRAGVVGAAGYLGGELLRLLIGHPETTLARAVSTRFCGRRVDFVHPNLRAVTDLCFCSMEDLRDCDVVFLATPHTVAMKTLPDLDAPCVIDLSADFRLRDPQAYARFYGVQHAAPDRLTDFVTGCPELFRDELRDAKRISVPGCMANAAMLALAPLTGMIEPAVQITALTGSSGAGSMSTADSHADRSRAMRVYAPVSHRHEAEVAQLTGLDVRMSVTAVEAVRGAQVVCHATAAQATGTLTERDLRQAYRARYGGEPFVRIVAHKQGTYRLPDPKILLGSNFCDLGFAAEGDRVTVIAALDNLMKGGSGNAMQCLNVAMGWPERLGLEFPGLYPA
ncbi:MAG TPA: N-acetyl-gamma-glutamyl-phosphate reductase [Streptosporangiaceae bacterium]|nr:N-acetyl-gamma-glutamyl-phosphate reductase [Streptosporangiaceae bacterium]